MTEKSDRKPSLILPASLTILALLAALYVWGYFELVMPEKTPGKPCYRVAPYPVDDWKYQGAATRFFAPMHAIDRKLRPHLWQPTD